MTARPHIVRAGRLWECRAPRTITGYGYQPHQALREWMLMNIYAGKPAGSAQEAPRQPPALMALVGTYPVESSDVHAS